jgi:hypothetical protein
MAWLREMRGQEARHEQDWLAITNQPSGCPVDSDMITL